MKKINTEREIYTAIFEIDKYKRAYLKCRIRNGFVQKNENIPIRARKKFAWKSRVLVTLIKKIIKNDFNNSEEYFLLTKACAIIESEIIILFNTFFKIKNIKKNKTFKGFYLDNELLIETFVGKSIGILFVQNHPFLSVTIYLLSVLALLVFVPFDQITKLIMSLLTIFALPFILVFITKNWDKMTSIFRANKTRNKYTFLNSSNTDYIDDVILNIIKSNAKIK